MNKLLLFDVDGTLTIPRNKIKSNIIDFLILLSSLPNITLGIISGSDYQKIKEQLGENVLNLFDYICTENGLVSFYKNKIIHSNSIIKEIGDFKYNLLINDIFLLMSKINLPIKRGNFIELRTGMINISPIGRSCTQQERDDFYQLDLQYQYRKFLVDNLKINHPYLEFVIGGQISIDIFPIGWNKTYCLNIIDYNKYNIYFIGDRMEVGGNDYELSKCDKIIPINVLNPNDMVSKIKHLLNLN